MSVVHIGFGVCACGSLRAAFRKSNQHQNEEIICIREDFSIGPIYKLESEEGIQERKKWMKELLTITGSDSEKDYLDWMETTLKSNPQVVMKIPNDSTVIIWHGRNASDEIGLRLVAFLLRNKKIQFEEVDVTEYSLHIKYKVRDQENKEIPYVLRNVGELPSKMILEALHRKKSIANTIVQSLINDWEKWSQTKDLLRIVVDGKIAAVSEDYYDRFILENTSNEYQKALRVVGEVMGKSDQCIGDTYLAFRVHQLIKQGQLSYRGNLGFLRDFEIRFV